MEPKDLSSILEQIHTIIGTGKFPKIKLKERTTDNIVWNPDLRQYSVGDKVKEKSLGNIAQARGLSQLIWMVSISKQLKQENLTSSQRDVYYLAQAEENGVPIAVPFKDQAESNNLLIDLECFLGVPRELLNIYPEERAFIYGKIKFSYPDSKNELSLESMEDGLPIGPKLTLANFFDCEANKIYLIEKAALWNRMVEKRIYERDKALLISTRGQAPRNARYLALRLSKEFNLDTSIITDSDPYGLAIANVIIYGSARLAHLTGLALPDAKWIGVHASDIEKYKLPSDPLEEVDKSRLRSLAKDPRCKDKLWQDEIKVFQTKGRKSEIESGSKYGLSWFVDKYLPEKIKER